MNIIVVGCGKIGTTVLSSLVNENHDVIGVDNDPAVIEQLTNIYDVMGVCGNGTDCDTLSEANVQKAELVIATTGSDELNMLCCFIARKMGAKHTIARIRNPEYNDRSFGFMCRHLGISLSINPELTAAHELYNILKLPSAAKVETFSKRNFEMVELKLKPDSSLDGIALSEMRKKFKSSFLICVVQRGDKVVIPDGNFVLKGGDKIGIAATPAEIQRLLKELKIMQKQARSVMILGASTTAYYLAKMLLNSGNSVKIIEKNPDRCQHFSELLPDAVIINGDGAQQELLLEEGIRSVDAFVSLTGMDEQNILISYFASSQNVPKVICKINRDEFTATADRLGLDCIISPKKIISDVIVRYARALHNSIGSNMETLYRLMDGSAEALEFNISSDCSLIGIPLKKMKTKDNILIAGIIRGRKTIIPSGEDTIQALDNVIIFASGHILNDVTDILK